MKARKLPRAALSLIHAWRVGDVGRGATQAAEPLMGAAGAAHSVW